MFRDVLKTVMVPIDFTFQHLPSCVYDLLQEGEKPEEIVTLRNETLTLETWGKVLISPPESKMQYIVFY